LGKLLQVQGLTRRFGGLEAVRDVTFSVPAGSITALIGPNGAGKTTLFNLVTGVLPPSEGAIFFDAQPIHGKRPSEIAHLGIARTFQNLQVFHNLNVLENVQVAASAAAQRYPFYLLRSLLRRQHEDQEARKIALAALARVGMADLAHRSAADLSFGQQRLLEIARALAARPRLLLLDEPASGLSPAEVKGLADLLLELKRGGLTIFLIEHDVATVMKVADRVVVLNHGEKLAEGSPREVQENPQVIAAYFGQDQLPARWATPAIPAGRPVLVVEDLHVRRGRLEVLHGVSLHVRQGELVAVVGPNGAGKSTLLGSLAGLYPPHRGAVTLQGQHVSNLPAEAVVARGLSLVPERRGMWAGLTVEESLKLGAFIKTGLAGSRRARREVDERLAEVYRFFPRLKERRRQLAGTLSGGEQQMLGIGRSLMAKPALLLLDEPSLGLAPMVVQEIFQGLADLKRQGTTILLVEQNTRAALGVADRVYVLERGRIVLEGRPDELAADPRLAEAYLGHTPGKAEPHVSTV